MNTYHKIQTIYKRNPDNMKHVLEGEFALPEFDYLQNNEWEFTEKVDGTNIRIKWEHSRVIIGGKTDNAQIPGPLYSALTEGTSAFDVMFMALFGNSNVCLYGEGYGPKIQSGGKYRPDHGFVLFDVWVDGWWLKRDAVEEVAGKFGLDVVPTIGRGPLCQMVHMVKNGLWSQWGHFEAEGIVARPVEQLFNRKGERIITKLKAKDFR